MWEEVAFWAYCLNTPRSLTIGADNPRPTISFTIKPTSCGTDTGTEAQKEVTTCLRSPVALQHIGDVGSPGCTP